VRKKQTNLEAAREPENLRIAFGFGKRLTRPARPAASRASAAPPP
jgi:hypothetical protein